MSRQNSPPLLRNSSPPSVQEQPRHIPPIYAPSSVASPLRRPAPLCPTLAGDWS